MVASNKNGDRIITPATDNKNDGNCAYYRFKQDLGVKTP